MAQRKLRPFVAILTLADALNDEQRADLLDYLRGKQPKKERKAQVRKTEKSEKAPKVEMCAICGNEKTYVDHQEDSPSYHVFRTSVKTKGSAAGTG